MFYFLKKGTGELADSKAGILDITVTSAANNGPIVGQPNWSQTIHSRTVVDFDLAKIVSDPDSDAELQVIRLDSRGAIGLGTSAAPVEGYAPGNMAFHFNNDIIAATRSPTR